MATLTPEMLYMYRQHLETFVSFTDEEWAIFAEHLYLRNIKKREAFITGGKVCHEIGFIISGSFRFFFVKEGVEISNYFCFENELVSSYKSFLKDEPSLINIEALETSEIICFSKPALLQLSSNPKVAFKMERFGRLVAEYLICCYEERVVSFVTQTPEERYQQLLQQQPDLLQRIPQHYVANFLGITPVSLSRIRKRISAASTKEKHTIAVA
ncbi:Crp/Fnr family transcriptional regulator [Adhaeribacter radiodurans]|uniref:Crp/Fnr family transcriptional regulator n=1 Tax=Adhaeribacter radiodurans TaxID=2745197 RepID=A0A7L7LEZ9_9BACT|nr:Crp/Fnr family transcriptional regulator [Adhaeribacter radiodurans]QMU31065.1 Crp/Fnr family transcriptional regulator [Adhaeribacter radiodurans]